MWYRRDVPVVLWPLLPISWLFWLLTFLRRTLYRVGALRSYRLPVPVIVVGNITVGGSGKTPFVLWLVERLVAAGWQPGIITRGYGGTLEGVRAVNACSPATLLGDEPLLLARHSGVPVFVGRDRVAAGKDLLAAHPGCNVLVSDDGLQHYRLQRSVELVMIDARGVGNGHLLPLGPLRELVSRLASVTAIVRNGCRELPVSWGRLALPSYDMQLVGRCFVSLTDSRKTCAPDELRGKRLYAVAGIGDPARFFAQLGELGLEFTAHAFPDHHRYTTSDLAFANDGVLLMTEKDAVKCAALNLAEAWVLPVKALIEDPPGQAGLLETILEKLNGCTLA
jgi:tetraacyldisaccharide 4'-kinase